jgi:predicted metal-dependent peptidase
LVINDMLVKSKIGKMPSCGLIDQKYTGEMLVDDVYRELKDDKKYKDSDSMDLHVLATPKETDAEWRRAVKTAAEAAKAMGKMPSALERFVDEFVNPQVSWQEKLRLIITKCAARDSTTWARPHRRRLVNQGIYMPNYTGIAAGEIVVAIDTSGSIGDRELTVFISELADILDTCRPEKIWVLGIDAAVNSVNELYGGHDLKAHPPELKGGGGTDFRPAFKWVENENIDAAAFIFFTDMYGVFPDEVPSYPVIWCATTDVGAPWGEHVRITT